MRRMAVLLLAAAAVSASASSTAARPASSAHPRIWLDHATLAALRARARAGTVEWKRLRAECDRYAGGKVSYPDGNAYPDTGVGEGYQGSGYWQAVLDLGLCAQTAPRGGAGYAKRVAEVLARMSEPGHEPDPLRDDGYGIRFYGPALAIGFDWAYASLSPAVRTQVIAALHRWVSAYERDGFEHDFPQGNYFAGYYEAKALAALATEGDDPQASAEWSDWLDRVHGKLVAPYYAANLAGGGWPEGWNYGPLATLDMTWPLDAARTAKGLKLAAGFPYAFDAPKFLVSFTWPTVKSLEDAGIQHDNDNPSAADPALATAEAGLLARLGSPFAATMHDYARRVRAANPKLVASPTWGAWVDFLYWSPKAPSRSITKLPRSYFAAGMGSAAMRSSWAKDAVWAEYKAAPYTGNPDAGEEFYDEGSLTILDGAKQFLVYAPSALMRNTPGTDDGQPYENLINGNIFDDGGARDLFNVFMTSRPEPTGQGDRSRADGARTATTFVDHGTWAVARTAHLEDMYPRDPSTDAAIDSWSRDVVYVRPRLFVVHDHTTVAMPTPDQWLAWSFLGRPAPSGDGRYRLPHGWAQPVLPAAHVERTIDVFSSHKVYRLEVRPGDGAATHDWLTVFWAGAGGAAGRTVTVPSGVGVQVGSTTVTFAGDGVSVSR